MTKQTITAALEYAHAAGVTLVAAAGNGHTDLAAADPADASSPDYPGGTEVTPHRDERLPGPARPRARTSSAVGRSGRPATKSDFSNYGLGVIDVAAPGG